MESINYTSVDEYIGYMPEENRKLLEQLRAAIKEAIPKAEEIISYNMPAYKYKKVLVYFALAKSHIGFYPTPAGIEAFKDELKPYKFAKGSVQFPLNQPLPLDLIRDISKFRFEAEK